MKDKAILAKHMNTIAMLENVLHIKLSKQQLNVLKCILRTQTLIDSCAGAGKTTLIMLKNLLLIIADQYRPNDILDITFTRKATRNMYTKFSSMVRCLRLHHAYPDIAGKPVFRTFSSLYLYILKKSIFDKTMKKNFRVISDPTKKYIYLAKYIPYRSKKISARALINRAFAERNTFIDRGFFANGLKRWGHDKQGNLTTEKLTPITLAIATGTLKDIEAHKDSKRHYHRIFANYFAIMKAYYRYKKQTYSIDYNDMKLMTFYAVSSPHQLKKVHNAVKNIRLCFIDEFQDINKIDWYLIKRILPKEALKRIVVIGDDDQSIYSFRGSSPQIILNFKKDYPSAKVFKLSNNYRTPKHVLNSVKPLINRNQYRMDKALDFVQQNNGNIYMFDNSTVGTKSISASDILLKEFWSKHKSSKVKDSDIAILVRYNMDGTLAADWCANHGLYTIPKYLLQDNKYYKQLMTLIHALVTNNVSQLVGYSTKIDFYTYKKHLKAIGNYIYTRNKSSSVHKKLLGDIPYFMKRVCNIDRYAPKSDKSYKEYRKHDKEVLKASETLSTRNPFSISSILALNLVLNITKTYYSWMSKKGFMNGRHIEKINSYLKQEMAQYDDINVFFSHEKKKIYIFRELKQSQDERGSNVHILTIHSAKGLQFKYVFLYNLTDVDITDSMPLINHYFRPHESRAEFLDTLLSLSSTDVKDLTQSESSDDKASHDSLAELIGLLHSQRKICLQTTASKKDAKNLFKELEHKLVHEKFGDYKWAKKDITKYNLQSEFDNVYIKVNNASSLVEEERRLIYVGVTRSSYNVYLNYGNLVEHANPLLKELQIPSDNLMQENKNREIVPELASARKKQQQIKLLKAMYKKKLAVIKSK